MRIPDIELARQAYAALKEDLQQVEQRIAEGPVGSPAHEAAIAEAGAIRNSLAKLRGAFGSPQR